MSHFGALLRWRREQAGLTQEDLAAKAGLNHSYISRLEAGARRPRREAVESLADSLDLDDAGRDALLDAAGYRAANLSSLLFEPLLAELDDLIAASRHEVREELRTLVRSAIARARWEMEAAA